MEVIGKSTQKSTWNLKVWYPTRPKNYQDRKNCQLKSEELVFYRPAIRDSFTLIRCCSPYRGLGYGILEGTNGNQYDVPYDYINKILKNGFPQELILMPYKQGGRMLWHHEDDWEPTDTYDLGLIDTLMRSAN